MTQAQMTVAVIAARLTPGDVLSLFTTRTIAVVA
jgi:hypothetical protein